MEIIKVLESRYSTKVFDPTKKITPEIMQQVKTLLQKAPSSTNVQPWHFIIAESEQAKKRVARATQGGFSFNEPKVLDASAVVVFASRVEAQDEYLEHVLEVEQSDGRFAAPEFKAQSDAGRRRFAGMHRDMLNDQQHWLEKQTYLNLGCFLLGVAALGLDAVPMEGCDVDELNKEFGLVDKGFKASFIVAIGYHAESDFNAALPKSRLPQSEVIEVL